MSDLFLNLRSSRDRLLRDGLIRGRSGASDLDLLDLSSCMALKVGERRVNTNTLLAKQVDQKRAGLVVPVGEGCLVVLVLLDVFHVLVEQISGIKRSALRFRVELSAENRSGDVDQSFVGLVIQVGEVFPPLAREGRWVNSITVVLRGNVALARSQVESRDVVRTVSVLELDSLRTSSESNELVTHAYAHNRDLGSLKELAKVVDGGCAVSWVTGTVGNEDTIKVVSDLMNGIVEGEACYASTTRHKAAEDVLLDTTIDQGNVHVAEGGADVEGSLGRDTTNKIDSLRIDVGFIFISIVLLADSNASKRRTLLTEVCHNLTGVNTGNGRDAFTSAPLSKRLDGGPVAVLQRVILNNDTGSLDVRGLEVSKQAVLVARS